MESTPLLTVAVAVLLGVFGQTLASLSRLPAIIFLLALGVAAGPYGAGLLEPADLGGGLPVLVSAFLAVILFEGALTLRPGILRQALAPVRRLVTVGAVITLAGAAALAHYLANLPWPLALLFAALVVVTGPTVIAPILRRVRLVPRLHAVIKSESILIDPVGVFVAVAVFQYVVGLASEQADWRQAALGFLARAGVGGAVGAGVGGLAALLARVRFFARPDNEHLVNLGALGFALGAFAAAEALQPESGVMAVIVLGLILAAAPVPFRDELEKFKDHITVLGVSVLFVLLSANLNLSLLLNAGAGEALLLLGLVALVRPAAVFLSTAGTGLTWREQAYLSLIAPRGILAAAMASYFSAELRAHGLPGANRIEMLVFLTIAVTVCLQGGWAALLARLLRVQPRQPQGVLLVGVNDWSLTVAEELRRLGRTVAFVDRNPANCDAARGRGFAAHERDATDADTYHSLDLAEIATVVAMTPNDAVNTLACEAAGKWVEPAGLTQVISKPVDQGRRPSKVRLGGRWAMPTRNAHRQVVELLRDQRLCLRTHRCREAVTLTADLNVGGEPLLPLLVLGPGRVEVATEGTVCGAGSTLIGLAAAEEGNHSVRPLPLARTG